MAGKGGGSWKVAYADFVTAMMAFFLVMWIGAQDTKVRQSVANYFVDPSGVSKKAVTSGAVMPSVSSGQMPSQESVDGSRGTKTLTNNDQHGAATRALSNWI